MGTELFRQITEMAASMRATSDKVDEVMQDRIGEITQLAQKISSLLGNERVKVLDSVIALAMTALIGAKDLDMKPYELAAIIMHLDEVTEFHVTKIVRESN